MSEEVTITIPSELAQELDLTGRELLVEILERGLREIKIERALERYAPGGISFGAAAQHAGVSQSELARHAYARGMELPIAPKRWLRKWVECNAGHSVRRWPPDGAEQTQPARPAVWSVSLSVPIIVVSYPWVKSNC